MFDKDEQEISQIIEAGLEAIQSGEATLEEVLQRHPQYAATIRPELEAALWLVSLRDEVSPRAGFISASRARVVARIQQEADQRGAKRAFLGFLIPQPRLATQWVAALVILFVLFAGTGGVVSFAQGALPGDKLYPIKRISENVAFRVVVSEARRVQLSVDFSERRLNEVESLVTRGELTQVEPVLDDFKNEVSNAVDLLEEVDDTNASEKVVLAAELKDNLSSHAERLEALGVSAPPEVREELEVARATSLGGASVANGVFERMMMSIPNTPTPTTTLTVAPTGTEAPATSTPEQTLTPAPEVGEEPEKEPGKEKTEPPAETTPVVSPGPEESAKPGNIGNGQNKEKVTKTPKPTNVNRPADPGKPDDVPNPPNIKPPKEEKPPKETKPPKEEKPPKEDKPPPGETSPADATSPPDEAKPPNENKPPDETKPPNENKPNDPGKPPKEDKPPKEEKPKKDK